MVSRILSHDGGNPDSHKCQLDSVIGKQVRLDREAKVSVIEGRHIGKLKRFDLWVKTQEAIGETVVS